VADTPIAEGIAKIACDPGMQRVYARLPGLNEHAWRKILRAAWEAQNVNYDAVRDHRRDVRDIMQNIAVHADRLAKALSHLAGASIEAPDELYSLQALMDSRPKFRQRLAPLVRLPPALPPSDDLPPELWCDLPASPPCDLAAAIEHVAEVARCWVPSPPDSVIGAALRSRKRTRKTAYLRAFLALLRTQGIMLSRPMLAGIARLAEVVLADSVSHDDVKKALARLPR